MSHQPKQNDTILIAKLTDQCRELEVQLAKCKEPLDYDPQAEKFGWLIENGWLPPDEVEKLRELAKCQLDPDVEGVKKVS